MQFPVKKWKDTLDIPVPGWATHQVDFTNNEESHSVWVGEGKYQYFKSTLKYRVIREPFLSVDWNMEKWEDAVGEFIYHKITDLREVEENE